MVTPNRMQLEKAVLNWFRHAKDRKKTKATNRDTNVQSRSQVPSEDSSDAEDEAVNAQSIDGDMRDVSNSRHDQRPAYDDRDDSSIRDY